MRLFDGSYLCPLPLSLQTHWHIVSFWTHWIAAIWDVDNMMLQSSYWGSPHLRTCKCRLSMWRAITKKLYCLCAKQLVHVCRKGSPLNCVMGWTFAVHFIYNFAAQHAWPSNVYIFLKKSSYVIRRCHPDYLGPKMSWEHPQIKLRRLIMVWHTPRWKEEEQWNRKLVQREAEWGNRTDRLHGGSTILHYRSFIVHLFFSVLVGFISR